MRMLKTCLAVTLCMFFYMLIGFQGESMPAEAAITAIICIQPDVRNTTENGRNRLSGTVIGAIWGFLFLLCMMWFPEIGKNRVVLYLLEGLGTLASIYTAVLIRKPDAAGLAAIVFVCVVISYPDIESPLQQAFTRILDVCLGTAIALFVNGFHLPRVKRQNKVFFIPVSCLSLLSRPCTSAPPPVRTMRFKSGSPFRMTLPAVCRNRFRPGEIPGKDAGPDGKTVYHGGGRFATVRAAGGGRKL